MEEWKFVEEVKTSELREFKMEFGKRLCVYTSKYQLWPPKNN